MLLDDLRRKDVDYQNKFIDKYLLFNYWIYKHLSVLKQAKNVISYLVLFFLNTRTTYEAFEQSFSNTSITQTIHYFRGDNSVSFTTHFTEVLSPDE